MFHMDNSLIQLMYISSATSWPTEIKLNKLLEQSRSRNLGNNITGMLIYHNATFMQALEGPQENVHQIFNSIKKDPRNTGIVALLEQDITAREFPHWTMGFKNLNTVSAATLPGFVDIL